MIDPVLLRENPDVLKRSQEARGDSVELVDDALEADRARRAAITEAERLRAEQNAFGKTVAKAPKDEKAALVAEAQAGGLTRLSLETGAQDSFRAARALYAGAGFAECGPFEGYGADPNSVFMSRSL